MNERWGAMPRRAWPWTLLVLALLIGLPAIGAAQSAASSRDSGRVYRFQYRRGDTNLVRVVRLTRQQLEERLDSLRREFEELGLDAPDRAQLSRELRTIILSLGNLSDIEETVRLRLTAPAIASSLRDSRRQLMGQARVMAGQMHPLVSTLQPGWIGINAEAPHERIVRNDSSYIRYFGYPEIVSVEPNSPAERVGIARGDVLVAYDGADLRDREINLTKLLQPSRRVTITVRRDGEERRFPLIVARPPLQVIERRQLSVPELLSDSLAGRVMMLRSPKRTSQVLTVDGDGTLALVGAKLVPINDDSFAHIFGVSSGVLVTEVFSDPAQAAGLRGGDVIVRADGRDLTSLSQLRRIVAVHSADRAVDLEIVRQRRTRSITLRW